MDDGGAPTLTPGIATMWGVRARNPKRHGPRLNLRRIVDAAVSLATREGLAAVSMSRLATELDTAPMSLYRHLADKRELLALMVDGAAGPAPDIPEAGESWRSAMTRWTRAFRLAAMRHPWAVQLPLSGPPVTPNLVNWMEHGLRCLNGTSLSPAERMSVLLLVTGYVRNDVATDAQLRAAMAASGSSGILDDYRRALLTVIEPQEFPALTAVINSGTLDHDDDPDIEFNFGLERILDGIGALVDA